MIALKLELCLVLTLYLITLHRVASQCQGRYVNLSATESVATQSQSDQSLCVSQSQMSYIAMLLEA